MGATEEYCLRWNDFLTNITGAFSELRDDEEFLDVSLVADGQTLKAHQLVLSACSPLFRNMLRKQSHPQPVIFLHGIRYCDVVAILNFMYHGEVNVNQEDLQTFLAAAEELRIRGLSDRNQCGDDHYHRTSKKRRRPSERSESASMDGLSPEKISNKTVPLSPTGSAESSPDRRPRRSLDTGARPGNSDQRNVSRTEKRRKQMVVMPDMPLADYQNASDVTGSENSPSCTSYGGNAGVGDDVHGLGDFPAAFPYDSSASDNHQDFYQHQSMLKPDDPTNGLGGGNVSYHPLGGRDACDPLSSLKVARSPHGWHCPHCPHVATTKGNLKSHILAGTHKAGNKPFTCRYCHKNYSTKQSLQVHVSTNHRAERERDNHLASTVASNSSHVPLDMDVARLPRPQRGYEASSQDFYHNV